MIPSFSRIEIRLPDKGSLSKTAEDLEKLAQEFRALGKSEIDETATLVLAHNAIRATSKKLRGIE